MSLITSFTVDSTADSLADVISTADLVLLASGASGSTNMMIVISDRLIVNGAALLAATQAAREKGAVLVVIDARTEQDQPWEEHVSSPEFLFRVRNFDSVEYAWFIQKSCCLGKNFTL